MEKKATCLSLSTCSARDAKAGIEGDSGAQGSEREDDFVIIEQGARECTSKYPNKPFSHCDQSALSPCLWVVPNNGWLSLAAKGNVT